ncbi:hypothetical protein [Thalassoroseus pseudoceratinae]|uniref:hypothetical protein n=1 Tax=Thalassoroseus pseudoceratinae TaxID=2713176 RepID=UPI00141EF0BC|nr:hypothetical protein [Thalassoroseus pseudoceratinae]
MNCDEAFDVLTQPDSPRRQELLWHLDMCPRCRELQKVLEPALLMFENHDSAPTGGSRESSMPFPMRQTLNSHVPRPVNVSEEALDLAEQTANQWKRNRVQRTWRRVGVVALSVCCMVIAVQSWMTRKSSLGTQTQAPTAATLPVDSCLWVAQDQDVSIPSTMSNHEIILSCVACHLHTDGSL